MSQRFKGKAPDYFWDFNRDTTEVMVYTDMKLQEAPLRIFRLTDERDEEGTCIAIVEAERFIKDLYEGREKVTDWLIK